jgi:hypothetical protein
MEFTKWCETCGVEWFSDNVNTPDNDHGCMSHQKERIDRLEMIVESLLESAND